VKALDLARLTNRSDTPGAYAGFGSTRKEQNKHQEKNFGTDDQTDKEGRSARDRHPGTKKNRGRYVGSYIADPESYIMYGVL